MKEKVEPRTLPGFMELLPQDQITFNNMVDTIRSVYEEFGFLPLDTPTIELSEVLLAKAGGETEKQIYRFMKGDTDLSLRFDLTVPLARYVAGHYNDLIFPFKRYQISKVFRGERPQKGRFREFYQCDIDIIGNDNLDLIYDAEIPSVIYHVFQKLNLGKFTIRINNRKILNGFFESLGLLEITSDILRVIDKIDKIGVSAVKEELKSLELTEEQIEKVLSFLAITGTNDEKIKALKELEIQTETFQTGLYELETVINSLRSFAILEDYFKIDLTIARGLDYYTGTVYETILDEYPKLGSICSGGRYENLADYYTEEHLPGVGISIGLTRLFSQLKEIGLVGESKTTISQVLIVPMDKENNAYVLETASKLRNKGIKTDVYYQDKGMKQKMKYADRLGIPYVLVIGETEVKEGKVAFKDMISGSQELISVEEVIERLTNC